MELEYLIAASNEMYVALAGEMIPERSTLTRIAAIGCRTLRNLVVDQEFLTAVVAISVGRTQYPEQFDDITGRLTSSLEHFRYFLDSEREVMLKAGFDTRLVEQLTVTARQLITRIRAWDGDFQALLAMTLQVRDQACQLATILTDEQERVEQRKEIVRQVRQIAYAVAGGAIIVLNAAVPPPLSPYGAIVSGAFGSALIGAAVPSA